MDSGKTEWFALSVIPRKEKVTAKTLRARGYEEFLPLYRERRRWSDRMKAVDLPLFPGYVFCRLNPGVRLPVLKIPTILDLVGFGRTPQPVDAAEIDSLQIVCSAGTHTIPCPYLTVGSKVRVQQGPLAGAEGILVKSDETRLVLSVSLLQRSVSVEIDREWVAPLRTLHAF